MPFNSSLPVSDTNPMPVSTSASYNPSLPLSDSNPMPITLTGGYNRNLPVSTANRYPCAAGGSYNPSLPVSDSNPLPVLLGSGYVPGKPLSPSNGWPVSGLDPSIFGGLLADYDDLKSGGELATVLYDRKPGGGANGTVGVNATYSAQGITTVGAGGITASDYCFTSGVASNQVRTVVVRVKPSSGGGVFASADAAGVNAKVWAEFLGNASIGDLLPTLTDGLGNHIRARMNANSWPFTLAFTLGDPGRMYLNGVEAAYYDLQNNFSGLAAGANPVRFATNFVNNGSLGGLWVRQLLFSTVLTPGQILQCHSYLAGQSANRGITPGGPVSLTGNFLGLVGNSLVNNMVTSQLLTAQAFDKLQASFTGATPSQFLALSGMTIGPLYRPGSARNFVFVWPTATLSGGSDVATYIAPLCKALRAIGFKVLVGTAISHSGFDAIKNAINAALDDKTTGWTSFADALADFRGVTEISADNAFTNPTYYIEAPTGLHLTPGNSGTNTGYGKVYPVIAAAVDSLG